MREAVVALRAGGIPDHEHVRVRKVPRPRGLEEPILWASHLKSPGGENEIDDRKHE